MLFDLRSGGRRRTVKTVYLGLALLMFVGFVGFGIGSSGLGGGIGDAITGNGSQGGGDEAAIERWERDIARAQAKTKATPSDPAAWSQLALARIGMSRVGDNLDPATGQFTAEGRRQLNAAGAAWDKYLALDPPNPEERLARQMTQAYVAIEQPAKAVGAQEILTEIEPSQQTFQNLAILSYQAGQLRKGDLAATKAVDLAPKDEQKDLKAELDNYKSQAAASQIQQQLPTPTPTVG